MRRLPKLHKNADNVLTSLTYEKDGQEFTMEGDYFISSMPVKDLVGGMNDVPADAGKNRQQDFLIVII